MIQATNSQRILGHLVQKIGEQIAEGECGLSDEEISELVEIIGSRQMTLEQTAKYLHVDRSTLTRKIQTGELPQPRKEPGGKKYYFLKDFKK